MKKITLLVLGVIFSSWAAFAQVPVGTQDGTTSNVPIMSCYNYSYTQQLIYQSEINAAGDITSISFYYDSGASTNSTGWTVYMGHTSKTEFASLSDWEPVSNMTQVFSGTVTYPAAGNMMTVTFDVPFNYNNTDNLVFAVDENQSGYNCSVYFGKTADLGAARGIYYRSDSIDPDPSAPLDAYATVNYINNIVLGGIVQACPFPTDLVSVSSTTTTATIDWTENGTATDWEVTYGPVGFDPASEGLTITDNDGTPGTELTGLNPSSSYDFYVRALCGGGEESMLAGPASFDTQCDTETVPYNLTFETGANCVTFENVGTGNDWTIVSGTNNGFTGIYARYSYNSSNPANAWLYTNAIALTGGTTYQISYKYGNNSTSYTEKMKVAYGTANNAAAMTTQLADHPNINQSTPQYNMVTFTPATTDVYYFGFNAYSDINQYYLHLDDISVIEAPSCPEPTSLMVSNITGSTADVAWTAGATETAWEVVYGAPGFDPTTDGTTIAVDTDPSVTIPGLSPSTDYEVYVRAICAVGDESDFVGPVSFTTLCGPATIPFAEGFESGYTDQTALGGCWTQESIAGTQTWVANNTETSYNRAPRTGDWNITLRYGNEDWIYQAFDLTGGTIYQLKFYARQDVTSGASVSAAYGTDNTAAAMTNTIIAQTSVVNGDYQEFSGVFTPATSGTYYLGIKATLNSSPWYISIDDITVDELTGCVAPFDLVTSNISVDTADLSWTPMGSATEWEVLYGETGFDPATDGTLVSDNDGTLGVTINGLSASTTYDWYVRTVCAPGDESDWAGPATFTTNCEATTVPYALDFESVTIPELPACTSVQNVGSGNNWETANVTSNGFDGQVLRYKWNTSNPANTWFYTQGLDLVAGVEYQISYRYGNNSSSYTESMKVAYGTAADAAAMTEELADYPTIVGGNATDEAIIFTVAADGIYYFGFNAYSATDQFYLYLDNISIIEAVDCEMVTDIAISDVESNTATATWTPVTSATQGYQVDVYLQGADPSTAPTVFTQTVAAGVGTVDVTDLDPDTAYDLYVTSLCDSGFSTMSDAVQFTTTDLGVDSNNLLQLSYFPNPVKDQLTVTSANTIDKVEVYNLLGQSVLQVMPRNNTVVVDMAALPAGTYILKASNQDNATTFKVVKQ